MYVIAHTTEKELEENRRFQSRDCPAPCFVSKNAKRQKKRTCPSRYSVKPTSPASCCLLCACDDAWSAEAECKIEQA